MAAMVATFAIREKELRPQAVTLALGLPVALASVSLSALLTSRWSSATDLRRPDLRAVFVRRFGDRGTALGLIGFQVYFLSLFVGATVPGCPPLYVCHRGGVRVQRVGAVRLVPATPARILERLRQAFRARLAQLIATQARLAGRRPRRHREDPGAAARPAPRGCTRRR